MPKLATRFSSHPFFHIMSHAVLAEDVVLWTGTYDSVTTIIGCYIVLASLARYPLRSKRLHDFFCKVVFLKTPSSQHTPHKLFIFLFALIRFTHCPWPPSSIQTRSFWNRVFATRHSSSPFVVKISVGIMAVMMVMMRGGRTVYGHRLPSC